MNAIHKVLNCRNKSQRMNVTAFFEFGIILIEAIWYLQKIGPGGEVIDKKWVIIDLMIGFCEISNTHHLPISPSLHLSISPHSSTPLLPHSPTPLLSIYNFK